MNIQKNRKLILNSITNRIDLNIAKLVDSQEIVATLFTDHSSFLDEQYYSLGQDGHYTIYHCILPTYEWFEKEMQREDNLITKGFEVYFTDGTQIFTYCNGKIKTVDSGVIANINTENTTISRALLLTILPPFFSAANTDTI